MLCHQNDTLSRKNFYLDILTFSNLNKNSFISRPPPYPTSFPLAPITRWQGTMMVIGLRLFAIPTARTALGLPMASAICL